MTDEVKDIIIGKMIDRPEDLTPEETALILSDTELRELYALSVRLGEEMSVPEAADVDAEWLKLREAIAPRQRRRFTARRWMGIAACIVAVLICGVMSVRYATEGETSEQAEKGTLYAIAPSDESKLNDEPALKETLEPVITIAKKKSTEKRRPATYKKSADDAGTDIDESVRVQQARIDNEVALLLSRLYKEEYAMDLGAMADMLEERAERGDSSEVKYQPVVNINQLTML